jgi:hypothetical protein
LADDVLPKSRIGVVSRIGSWNKVQDANLFPREKGPAGPDFVVIQTIRTCESPGSLFGSIGFRTYFMVCVVSRMDRACLRPGFIFRLHRSL